MTVHWPTRIPSSFRQSLSYLFCFVLHLYPGPVKVAVPVVAEGNVLLPLPTLADDIMTHAHTQVPKYYPEEQKGNQIRPNDLISTLGGGIAGREREKG